MGCGSSSQTVKQFQDPEENRSYKVRNDQSNTLDNNGIASPAGNKRTCPENPNDKLVGTNDSNNSKPDANDSRNNESAPVRDGDDANRFAGKPEHQTDNTQQQNAEFNEDTQSVDDTESFADLDLIPLKIPKVVEGSGKKELTIDNINDHNTEVGSTEWFCYAGNVYDRTLIISIVKERFDQYIKEEGFSSYYWDRLHVRYPIYTLRRTCISRKSLAKLLPAAQVGVRVQLPREEYLWRFKQSAEDLKEQLLDYSSRSITENDFLDQITRWLATFPNAPTETVAPNGNVNDAEFQIPEKFKLDPTPFQRWIEDWEEFDTKIPEDGAWVMVPFVYGKIGDVHALFAELVAQRADPDMPNMDMEIDGVVAWEDIEIDLVKNEITTVEQDEIIKSRERRTDLLDKERMRYRRLRIAERMSARHNRRVSEQECSAESEFSDSYMAEYLGWAERLEQQWNEFQKLCEKEFTPPQRYSVLYGDSDDDKVSETVTHANNSVPYDSSPGDNDENGPDVLKL